MHRFTLRLTDEESMVARDLAAQQGLSQQKMLIQALRLYQVSLAFPDILEKLNQRIYGDSPGCMGDG